MTIKVLIIEIDVIVLCSFEDRMGSLVLRFGQFDRSWMFKRLANSCFLCLFWFSIFVFSVSTAPFVWTLTQVKAFRASQQPGWIWLNLAKLMNLVDLVDLVDLVVGRQSKAWNWRMTAQSRNPPNPPSWEETTSVYIVYIYIYHISVSFNPVVCLQFRGSCKCEEHRKIPWASFNWPFCLNFRWPRSSQLVSSQAGHIDCQQSAWTKWCSSRETAQKAILIHDNPWIVIRSPRSKWALCF